MNKPKLPKLLVSKGRYVRVMGKKVGLYSYATALMLFGVFSVALVMMGMFLTFTIARQQDLKDAGIALMFTLVALGFTYGLFWNSRSLFKQGQDIETVAPITDHNAHLLPLQEILVRASDVPAEPQVELLRAVQTGPETPPEQLLRVGDNPQS